MSQWRNIMTESNMKNDKNYIDWIKDNLITFVLGVLVIILLFLLFNKDTPQGNKDTPKTNTSTPLGVGKNDKLQIFKPDGEPVSLSKCQLSSNIKNDTAGPQCEINLKKFHTLRTKTITIIESEGIGSVRCCVTEIDDGIAYEYCEDQPSSPCLPGWYLN